MEVNKQKLKLSNARLMTRETENEIVKSTQQLINDFLSAKRRYVLQATSLEQGRFSYEAYEEKHKLGYITALELISAKDQLYLQQVKTAAARYDLYFKYKLVELLLKVSD